LVSGSERSAVVSHARLLERIVRNDPSFHRILAPDVHPFFESRALYYLQPDRLETWLTAIAFDPSSLDRLLARGPGTEQGDTHYLSILLQGTAAAGTAAAAAGIIGTSIPHG